MENNWTDASILPEKSGKYEVKNNSGVNCGIGYVWFRVGQGWDIADPIRDFYRILAWREDEDTFDF
jgi:hypothetical protein